MSSAHIIEDYLAATVHGMELFGFKKPEGWNYLSIQDYLLDTGKEFGTTEYPAEDIIREIQESPFVRMAVQECFANCQGAALLLNDPRVLYAEGFALSSGSLPLPVLHAWLVIEGKVYDPTWEMVGHYDRKTSAYFGRTFETGYVRRSVLDSRMYESLIDAWRHGYPLLQEERRYPGNERQVGGV